LLDKHYQHTVVKRGQCGGDHSKVDTETDISVTAFDVKANKNQ